MSNKQCGTWVSINDSPIKNGWYMVRSKDETRSAMYFKNEKRSYSDSQWFTSMNNNHSWQGLLPNGWLHLEGVGKRAY